MSRMPTRPGFMQRIKRLASSRRGVAILLVIAVLAGLVALSAPFVMSMVLHGRQARNDVTSLQARSGAEAAIAHATAQLYKTTMRDEAAVANGDPFVTTPADLKVVMDFPAVVVQMEQLGVNVNNPNGMMWSAKVEDEQGKINISTAHPVVLGNLMGSGLLTENAPAGAVVLNIDDGSLFRADGGTISLNGEPGVIRYTRATKNSIFLERGVTRAHLEGAVVYDGRARLLADYKWRGDNGQYQPLKSIYELKAALQGADFIGPDEFARIERHITVQSGLGGPLWGHSQIPPQPAAGTRINGFSVEKGEGFTPGGLIRMVINGEAKGFRRLDGVNLRGDGSASMGWGQDWEVPQMGSGGNGLLVVQPEFQHPVNINTASAEVLEAVFTGLCMFGSKEAISREKAQLLVDLLRERNVYATRDHLKKAFDDAHNRGLLTASQRDACYINAVEPNSPKLRTSTVPLVFHTFGHFTIEGSGVVNSDNGLQLSRNTQRQLLSLPTPWPGHFKIQYQRQFQELLDKGLGARVVTFPEPMGAQRYKRNIASVRLGRGESGGVRLDVGETGPHGFPGEWLEHCSDPNDAGFRADGYDMGKRGPFDIDRDTPSQGGGGSGAARSNQPMVARVQRGGPSGRTRPQGGVSLNATQPSAIELWYKPIGGGQGVFYDEGLEDDRNRVTFSYSPGKGLMIEMCDAGYECQGIKTSFNHLQRNPVQYIFPVDLTPGDWHHVAASWKAGCFNGMEIRYDAQFSPPTGDTVIQKPGTRLARSLSLTDDTVALDEAPDEDFPARGAVRIGEEIIEYNQKAGNTLTQCRRGSRMTAIARHDSGEVVVPHGYSVPIDEDWYVGGAKLVDRLASLTELSNCRVDVPKPPPNDFVVHTDTKEIPVNDASMFPTSGYVLISGELIYYAKRSATKLQDLQRAQTGRTGGSPARNLRNGSRVNLVSIEITNSNDYPDSGIVQLDDETDDKIVEWLHYTVKRVMNGKHYLMANVYNTPIGGIQQNNPPVNVPDQAQLGYEQHGNPNDPNGNPADYQYSFRGCFNIGFRQAHAKKTNVIPVMRVSRPDCGDRYSAFGERGVSEVSIVERGSTSGDLMYIKQAATFQEAIPRRDNNGRIIDLADWNIQYFVGLNDFLSRRYPRNNTRVMKWPSGELPDAVGARRIVGASRDGSGQLRGHVDEIKFNQLNTRTARIAMQSSGEGITAADNTIILEDYDAYPQDFGGWPPRGTRTLNLGTWPQAGLIRIEDELIYYESYSTGNNFRYFSDNFPRLNNGQPAPQSKAEREYSFQNGRNEPRVTLHRPNECNAQGATITRLKRGVFGTDAKDHPVGAMVVLLDAVAVSPLASNITGRADSLTLKNGAGFAREGYVWVNNEVISYLDGGGQGGAPNGSNVTLTGIRNFRGRFGTREDSHEAGDLVRSLPFRYWDRNPLYEESDGIAFVQGGYYAQDGIWDSIELETKGTEEYPKPNAVRPRILARFNGLPSWSAEPNNVDGALWEFRSKDGLIPLRLETGRGVRADEAELRVYWEYKSGAFIPGADWKRTFQIEKMRMNYRTPLIIRRLDELERR